MSRSTLFPTLALMAALAPATAGCATSFLGEAHVPGGARGCAAACQREGLVMSAYVIMGEYSSGCVCEAPAAKTAASAAAAGAVPAAAGVVMQMRRASHQQQLTQR
jgi:hypothetical protein